MRAVGLAPWGLHALGVALIVWAALNDTRLALILGVWFGAWALNAWLSERAHRRGARLVVPLIFGVTLLALWEMAVQLYDISFVILPAPSAIWARIVTETATLWADFQQTIDEHPQAKLRRHTTCADMGTAQKSKIFKVLHHVSDRGGADLFG